MELALVIWAITSLNAIGGFIFAVACAFVALAVISALNSTKTYHDPNQSKVWAKRSWRSIIAAVCMFGFLSLMPTTKTGWLMAGGYLTQTALQSDMAKKFSSIVEIKLEEVLDEATKQAKIKAGSINEKKE